MSTPLTTSTPIPEPASPPTTGATGRPRDPRIDEAVLQATRDLLEEVGYLSLTIGAIAERAGTNKPAIYRRWPTKAHVVHEAVFPADGPDVTPAGDDLRADIRALVATGVDILGRPSAVAALPGLIAEMNNDPTRHLELLGRFASGTWAWLDDRIVQAIDDGEVRPGVRSSMVLDLIAGSTLVATAIRPRDQVDEGWVDEVVEIIMRGIAP